MFHKLVRHLCHCCAHAHVGCHAGSAATPSVAPGSGQRGGLLCTRVRTTRQLYIKCCKLSQVPANAKFDDARTHLACAGNSVSCTARRSRTAGGHFAVNTVSGEAYLLFTPYRLSWFKTPQATALDVLNKARVHVSPSGTNALCTAPFSFRSFPIDGKQAQA